MLSLFLKTPCHPSVSQLHGMTRTTGAAGACGSQGGVLFRFRSAMHWDYSRGDPGCVRLQNGLDDRPDLVAQPFSQLEVPPHCSGELALDWVSPNWFEPTHHGRISADNRCFALRIRRFSPPILRTCLNVKSSRSKRSTNAQDARRRSYADYQEIHHWIS